MDIFRMKKDIYMEKYRGNKSRPLPLRMPEGGRWQRIDDGLGFLSPKKRYKLRARYDGRCPDCGKPVEPERRTVRCKACTDKRTERGRRARLARLALDGASDAELVAAVIGGPRRRSRQRVFPLEICCARCGFPQVIHWQGQEGCKRCAWPVWPAGMNRRMRRRWLCMPEEKRAALAIG